METILLTVEDHFEIQGRGVVLLPGVDICYQGTEDREVVVRSPQGEVRRWAAYIQIPRVSPPPEKLFALIFLRGAKKADVPIGSKVWFDKAQA